VFLLTKNGVDAVVLALDNELCHDHHVLGVHRPVRDPVLLRQRVRGVHDEFCNNKSNFQIITFSASVLSIKGNS
jgi:hypothetical protein